MPLLPTDKSLFFKGRDGDPRIGELIQPWSAPLNSAHDSSAERFQLHGTTDLVIYGCPDDLGVISNRGRAGAAGGPDGIRSMLYKMCPPLDWQPDSKMKLFDGGNIAVGSDILKNHEEAFAAAVTVSGVGATAIALGGGHDFAAPNILGWCKGRRAFKGKTKKASFGLINVDPHLDVRELENGLPHSGTPFRQILESKEILGPHFVEFGAREGRNAHQHFAYCKQKHVKIWEFDSLRSKPKSLSVFAKELAALEKAVTDIAVTVDMDSCSDLEGVSAAPVIGFSAWELCQFAFAAGKSKKVSFFELAEVAPKLDPTGRSARIAAEVLFYFVKGRLRLR